MSTTLLSHSGPIRWGILGPGSIAHKLTKSVQAQPETHAVQAVGSRDKTKAQAFADQYGIPNAHGSYEALCADPDVDVIYVATPHPLHKEHCLLAIAHGKHVLCEKPFTINAVELQEVVDAARVKGVFMMEAMWSRFFPLMHKLRDLLDAKAIGDVRMVYADFGFSATFNPESRLFDPALGGGALLDVGVYAVSFTSFVLGEPVRVESMMTPAPTGVDAQAACILGYEGGELALVSTAVTTNTPWEATILGTNGKIRLHASAWHPTKMTVSITGQPDDLQEFDAHETGFYYEVEEVGNCLRAGKLESDILPLDESLGIMRTLDRIRAPWGFKYPTEA